MNRLIIALGILTGTISITPTGAMGQNQPPVGPDHVKRVKAGLKIFKSHVRAALAKHCLECHGGGKRPRGGFDLSSRQSMMKSGSVAKTAIASVLYKVITHSKEPYMPHKRAKLPKKTIDQIAKWIDLGAPFDKPLIVKKNVESPKIAKITDEHRDFWSFRPIKVTVPPKIKNEAWVRTPIDRFILAELESTGLRPNVATDRRKLIRRAYFALIGLPPTPEQVQSFVNDKNPKAYESLIDGLLSSPHYGERWARHWMDVARFAESHGYEQDYTRNHAFHYRDFLIKAFNQDLPYDRFVRWQIAGDELAPESSLAMTATGFLGAGSFPTQLTEKEFESSRYDELDDMTATTGVAFLGLTLGCARCHDHKYDPIPTKDYYRLVSTFTTTIRSEIDLGVEPGKKAVKVMVTSEGFKKMKHHADGRGFPHYYKMTHLLNRGDVHQKRGVVSQSFLQVLMRNGKEESHWQAKPPSGWKRTSFRRAALANWLTDTKDGAGHLAARVIVNRLWHHHFGRGIVATPNDFGKQGERPTHLELLDWLANDLVKNGWKLKRLHKLIMTSAVYMQSSDFDKSRAKIDRENRYLWRWKPRRLEAEPIRDSMLHVAGMLDKRMFGPGTLDQNMKRRSVYFFIKRSKLIPVMMLFDWPEHLVSIGRRSTTTTPTQALMFMNSPQGRQYAEGFAKRLASEKSPIESVQRGYEIAFGRPPSNREQMTLTQFLQRQTASHQKAGRQNAPFLAMVDVCQTLMSMNEFIFVD